MEVQNSNTWICQVHATQYNTYKVIHTYKNIVFVTYMRRRVLSECRLMWTRIDCTDRDLAYLAWHNALSFRGDHRSQTICPHPALSYAVTFIFLQLDLLFRPTCISCCPLFFLASFRGIHHWSSLVLFPYGFAVSTVHCSACLPMVSSFLLWVYGWGKVSSSNKVRFYSIFPYVRCPKLPKCGVRVPPIPIKLPYGAG